MTLRSSKQLILLVLAPGMAALLSEPLGWLLTTWTDPSWDSQGYLAFLAVGLLLMRSVLSGPAPEDRRARRLAIWLLVATALVRLAGRLLAIHVLGALALVFDIAALAILLRVGHRPWALHPLALAALFACALPLEQMLQRLCGFPLRVLSATAAHSLLQPFVDGLERQGTLLLHGGNTLAIDLPCSGAQGLLLLVALAALILTRRRPGRSGLALAALLVPGGALLANTARIIGLYLAQSAGWQIMDEPFHSTMGLLALALGTLPLLLTARNWPGRTPSDRPSAPTNPVDEPGSGRTRPVTGLPAWLKKTWHKVALAGGFSMVCLAIAAAPAHPIDVSTTSAGVNLPSTLGTWISEPTPLSAAEKHYYRKYGGRVEKRTYRNREGLTQTALLVQTNSPLRHLHGPDRCLLGAGHKVSRLGVRPGAVPSVVWQSKAPDGRSWRVEASFLGQDSQTATTISEVVWRWMAQPGTRWTLLERISPFDSCARDRSTCDHFEAALFAALDLPIKTEEPR